MCHVYSKFANRRESSVVNNVMTHSGDQARAMDMDEGVHRFFCSFMALMPRYAKTIRYLGKGSAKKDRLCLPTSSPQELSFFGKENLDSCSQEKR